jgi:transcriptional regulator with XRE-family HTH domain
MDKQPPNPKVPLPQTIGNRIRHLRTTRNWTQRALAAQTGIDTARLSQYENGQVEPPLRALLRLARAFEVPLDLLVREPSQTPGTMDDRVLERLRQVDTLEERDRGAVIALLDILLGVMQFLHERSTSGKG